MGLIETIKQAVAPEIICPGATPDQITDFLRRNTLIGGRVTLDSPTQLAIINGQVMIGGELKLRKGSGISHSLSIGSRIDIGGDED